MFIESGVVGIYTPSPARFLGPPIPFPFPFPSEALSISIFRNVEGNLGTCRRLLAFLPTLSTNLW